MFGSHRCWAAGHDIAWFLPEITTQHKDSSTGKIQVKNKFSFPRTHPASQIPNFHGSGDDDDATITHPNTHEIFTSDLYSSDAIGSCPTKCSWIPEGMDEAYTDSSTASKSIVCFGFSPVALLRE